MLVYSKDNAIEILENKVVFVDFWAPWCGPCRALGPIFEDLAEKYGGSAVFAKCNVDDNETFARRHGIASIPCIICFVNGEEVDRSLGFLPQEEIELFIQKNI